jgi:uncharacterized protein YqfB (UPF0267 family)
MFNFFKKNPSNQKDNKAKSLEEFCDYFNNENDINVLKLLNIPLESLTKAHQSQINSNIADKKNGVVAVYYNNQISLFGIFKSIVHKVYNDDSKQYFMHTTTNDVVLVKQIADTFYEKFGEGNYNPEKFSSFKDISKIEDIANGFASSEKDECVNWWRGKIDTNSKFQIYLQYRVDPLRQLILHVNESGLKS